MNEYLFRYIYEGQSKGRTVTVRIQLDNDSTALQFARELSTKSYIEEVWNNSSKTELYNHKKPRLYQNINFLNKDTMYLKLTPAYGRDYKSEEDVLKDWDEDKDFIINNPEVKGRYINKSDFIRYRDLYPITYIHFRYSGARKVKVIKVTEETFSS